MKQTPPASPLMQRANPMKNIMGKAFGTTANAQPDPSTNRPVTNLSAEVNVEMQTMKKKKSSLKSIQSRGSVRKAGSKKMLREGSKHSTRFAEPNGVSSRSLGWENSNSRKEKRLTSKKSTVIIEDGVNVGLTKSKKASILTHRALVVFCAIVLLWSSSLGVCRALVSYVIATPPADDVLCVCSAAYDYTLEYHDYYVECVLCNSLQCELGYTDSISDELAKVELLETQNRETVTQSLANQQQCSSARVAARSTLQKYQAAGLNWTVSPTAMTDPLCSFDSNGQLELTGVQNVQSARSDALDVARAFTETAAEDIRIMSAYISQRSDYDASYVANKSTNVNVIVDDIPGLIDPSVVAADIVPTGVAHFLRHFLP